MRIRFKTFVFMGLPLLLIAWLFIDPKLTPWLSTKKLPTQDSNQAYINSKLLVEQDISLPLSRSQQKRPSKKTPPSLQKNQPKTGLSTDEKSAFDRDLLYFFTELAPATLNPALSKAALQKLNARGSRGVAAILSDLRTPPASDKAALLRMAQVDYLRYRMKWDASFLAATEEFILEALPEHLSHDIQAIVLADKAELLGGIARLNWNMAANILSQISHPLLKDLASYEAFHGLKARGDSQQEALALIHEIDHNFMP